jgi:hypothetical protein
MGSMDLRNGGRGRALERRGEGPSDTAAAPALNSTNPALSPSPHYDPPDASETFNLRAPNSQRSTVVILRGSTQYGPDVRPRIGRSLSTIAELLKLSEERREAALYKVALESGVVRVASDRPTEILQIAGLALREITTLYALNRPEQKEAVALAERLQCAKAGL